MEKKKVIKGYKVFNPDWTCRGFQYEVGKTYEHNGDIEMCGAGFHFCRKLSDCFNYYSFNPKNKVAEIEAIGNVETRDDKSVTDKITILKELSWYEVLDLCNTGDFNTGYRNTGDCNTGDCNTGDRNTGDFNTGYRNTGNRNTGYRNTGDRNTGDFNTGDWNTGDFNTGYRNTGDRNTGDFNTGYRNTGNRNAGGFNTGNCNTGDFNTGDFNTGNWNTGDWNTGDRNTGNCNTGDFNTGDWNSISHSTGFFNTIEQPLFCFNKICDKKAGDINEHYAVRALSWKYENNWWVFSENMTEDEKREHPEHETLGGYLKVVDFKTACAMMWDNMTDDEKKAVWTIPNFDPGVFKEITGIEVAKNED